MLENLLAAVKIFEVGPRDGLQNEPKLVSTADKVRLIESLAETGLKNIEITSFVSPRWIPQLADAKELLGALHLAPDIVASALIPNLKGYHAAREAGLKHIALFMSATESHNRKNINKSTDESLATLKDVLQLAHADGCWIRAYLSVVFVCPYEGLVRPLSVARLVEKLLTMGVDELSLGDTTGAATPHQVMGLLKILSGELDLSCTALHFHDTYGMALANVLTGLEAGVTTFDASIGGMGGCPYAPGASGNLATEDLVYLMEGLGIRTGIDLNKLVDSGALAQTILEKKLPGRCLQAKLAARKQ